MDSSNTVGATGDKASLASTSGKNTAPTSGDKLAENTRICTLADLKPGESGTIINIEASCTASSHRRRRLMEMGFCHNTTIKCIRVAPFGDPVEYRLRHYNISLRKHQARTIQVCTPATQHTEASKSLVLTPPEPIELTSEATIPATVALLGNPNCGKTSLFNRLTGLRQKVANYAGVTVTKTTGQCHIKKQQCTLIDLPGTYSLAPTSPDEQVTCDTLLGRRNDTDVPDCLLVILDAANLPHHLYILNEAIELGLPTVVALNMIDRAEHLGIQIDHTALSTYIGAPVIPVSAYTRVGIEQLRTALSQARVPHHPPAQHIPDLLSEAIDTAHAGISTAFTHTSKERSRLLTQRLICENDSIIRYAKNGDESLVVMVTEAQKKLAAAQIDPVATDIESRFEWVDAIMHTWVTTPSTNVGTQSQMHERLDRVLVHPVFGLIGFSAIMFAVFYTVFSVAAPLSDMVEEGIGTFSVWVCSFINPGAFYDLIHDGVFAGVGGVLVFIPQIALLFLLLSILEDSGYLARASFLMDRILSQVGLHGKSFIPLLSSHACAIPGIMAARSIGNTSDRLITMFVAPFMACSARLPVYTLLIAVFFASESALTQSLIFFGLYAFGIVAAFLTAYIGRKCTMHNSSQSFVLEFPAYKIPQLRAIARSMFDNAMHFVKKAGTIILAFSVLIWAALRYPEISLEDKQATIQEHGMSLAQWESIEQKAETSVEPAALNHYTAIQHAIEAKQTEESIAGIIGHSIEPLIAPMGFDWKIGIGLLGAFGAREVFVSTIGITYSLGSDTDEENTDLHAAIRADTRDDGTPLWTIPVVISLFIWFAIAMQCISTVAIMHKETGSWKWSLGQLVYMNGLAFILATIVYTTLS